MTMIVAQMLLQFSKLVQPTFELVTTNSAIKKLKQSGH